MIVSQHLIYLQSLLHGRNEQCCQTNKYNENKQYTGNMLEADPIFHVYFQRTVLNFDDGAFVGEFVSIKLNFLFLDLWNVLDMLIRLIFKLRPILY
jgi:hypothetical protein